MPVDKKILEEAAAKIDNETLKRIISIVDTHRGAKNDDIDYVSDYSDPFHWRIAINQLHHDEVFKIDRDGYSKGSHQESKFYRSQGMHILPDSKQYAALKEVENYIRKDMGSSGHIHEICESQQQELEQENLVRRNEHEKELSKDIIMFCGHKYKLSDKYRAEYEMDTIEEFYIKALAVSIMAESDGDSQTAKDILDNGGMAIIKNLDQESVMDLLQDLQVIALTGEDIVEQQDKGIER